MLKAAPKLINALLSKALGVKWLGGATKNAEDGKGPCGLNLKTTVKSYVGPRDRC